MFSSVFALLLGFYMLVAEDGELNCSADNTPLIINVTSITSQSQKGILENNYTWEIWSVPDGNYDPGTVTFYNVDGAFKAAWNNSGNFLARVGLQLEPDGRKGCNYKDYGDIIAEYSYTKAPPADDSAKSSDLAGDFSYIGIYGWAKNPLVEFYIVEDWFGNNDHFDDEPITNYTICSDEPDCQVGSYMLDGSEYYIYKQTRGLSYTIEGDDKKPFYQYFSVRQNTRNCGTIHVNEHFKKWENLSMDLNEMYEVKLLVQAGGGVGWIDYNYATIKAEEQSCSQDKAVDTCLEAPQTGGTTFTGKEKIDQKSNGYAWEIWSSPAADKIPGTITLYDQDATFKAEWKDTGNFIARVGLQFEKGEKKGCNYEDYGDIVADISYTRSNASVYSDALAGGYSYIGIYGWARNPLIEFYIVEDWFGNKDQLDSVPINNNSICYDQPNCQVGKYIVDSSEYYVYNRTRIGDNIDKIPDATVVQYYSVRQNTRHCGKINLHQHFKQWGELDMPVNEMYEAKIFVQSGGGEGWIDYSTATITTAENPDPCPATGTPGSAYSWNKRVWVPMVVLWVALLMFW